jgi:hypothetical protein
MHQNEEEEEEEEEDGPCDQQHVAMVWEYKGRPIPMEVRWRKSDEQMLVEALADFLWKNRHLAYPAENSTPEGSQ